jgi:hypothetical protein
VRDFTLKKYEHLLRDIKKTDYLTTKVCDFLESLPNKCIILRHDVDRDIARNLAMAKLEHNYGIKSTFYFRHIQEIFKPEIILKIAEMGHEIGYHYEVMDKANGNYENAIEIFKYELKDFREIVDIKTICMHGNPLKPWSNRDLWNKFDFRDFDIIGEPYLSIDYDKVLYLTDTGRTWKNSKIRVKDVIDKQSGDINDLLGDISSTDDVIKLINGELHSRICLLIHPNRWCEDLGGWTRELVLQNIKNIGKAAIVIYRK